MSGGDGFDPRDHVTEREPGPWRDCTFASMLEALRAGFPDGEAIPPTVAEKEAYRAAAGLPDDHAGANIPTAVAAAERRYDLGSGYLVTANWATIREALLTVGKRLVVTGSMARVPAHLRRWDTGFTGAHAVAGRGGPAPIWCDPLAPAGTYAGEPVGIATWQAFFTGLPGAQAFITTVGGLVRGYEMAGDFVVYDEVGSRRTGRVSGATPFFNDWELRDRRGAIGAAGATVQVLGYRGDAYAIKVNTAQGWSDGKTRPTNVYVAKSRVSAIVVAPPAPSCEAQVVAAREEGRQAGLLEAEAKWEAWVATHP